MPPETRSDALSGTFSLADVIRVMDLSWGADAAVSISTIAERHNVSRRAVEESLQELALTGYVPLVAGPTGVYLEADPAAVERYAAALRHRLVNQYRRIRALRRCARAMRGTEQQTLWDAA